MQVHPCTFYRQEEMVNRRTHSAPRRGLPERNRPRPGASRSAAIRRICRDHPCEEFLDRRPFFAVAQMTRQRQVRRAWLCRDAFVRSRSARAALAGGISYCAGVFEMRCFARRQPDNSQRRHGAAAARMPERTESAAARTRQIVRLGSTAARRVRAWGGAKIRRPMAPGCGTGLIHCGGQTDRRFAAEMR
jgi:hypothetical protein